MTTLLGLIFGAVFAFPIGVIAAFLSILFGARPRTTMDVGMSVFFLITTISFALSIFDPERFLALLRFLTFTPAWRAF